MGTLFRSGVIFDGTGEELLEGVEVLVDGDRIAEVSDVPIRTATAEVIDLQGRMLMPGLIDAHYHALAASPDLGAVEGMPESLLAQHARRYLEATLQRGFTTVRDAAVHELRAGRAIDTCLAARVDWPLRARPRHGSRLTFGATSRRAQYSRGHRIEALLESRTESPRSGAPRSRSRRGPPKSRSWVRAACRRQAFPSRTCVLGRGDSIAIGSHAVCPG